MEANRKDYRRAQIAQDDREEMACFGYLFQTGMSSFSWLDLSELLEQAWGWERLVPLNGFLDWPIDMNYLKDYYGRDNL